MIDEACEYDRLRSAEIPPAETPKQGFGEIGEGKPTTLWITPSLVGINLLLFVVMACTGVSIMSPDVQSLSNWGANVGPLTAGGQWWRLFTCMFLHIGLIHLLFNMFVLWGIGRVFERFVGSIELTVVYLIAGLFGSLASIGWNPDVVSAGASGAIFGVYGALLGFLLRDPHSIPRAVQKITAKNALIFIAYNLVFGLVNRHVDVAAHLGGLISGFICGFAIVQQHTADAAKRRVRSNLFVLVGGLITLSATAWSIPKERGISVEFAKATAIERQALRHFDDAVVKARAGALSESGFANIIDREVLPELHEFRVRLSVLANNPRANIKMVEAMERYTTAREAAFAHMAHALRTGNQEEVKNAIEQQEVAANRFSEEMKNAKQ